MLSNGTGFGPFLSILKTVQAWRRLNKLVWVQAVRNAAELAYRELIDELSAKHPDQFCYVPFVSREKTDFSLPGRIPAGFKNGSLEKRAGIKVEEGKSQIMLCGNPDMVKDTRELLQKRGLTKNLRRTPGSISTENYW